MLLLFLQKYENLKRGKTILEKKEIVPKKTVRIRTAALSISDKNSGRIYGLKIHFK